MNEWLNIHQRKIHLESCSEFSDTKRGNDLLLDIAPMPFGEQASHLMIDSSTGWNIKSHQVFVMEMEPNGKL